MEGETVVTLEITSRVCKDQQRLNEYHIVNKGTCNSSHGGSCCTCGGSLPLIHIDIHVKSDSFTKGNMPFPIQWAGNICSEECAGKFVEFARHEQKFNSNWSGLCPGHNSGIRYENDKGLFELTTTCEWLHCYFHTIWPDRE